MNRSIRAFHRWTSVAFVAGMLAYIAFMIAGPVPAWAGILPVVPLLLLLATGLYLFALPYAARRRQA